MPPIASDGLGEQHYSARCFNVRLDTCAVNTYFIYALLLLCGRRSATSWPYYLLELRHNLVDCRTKRLVTVDAALE